MCRICPQTGQNDTNLKKAREKRRETDLNFTLRRFAAKVGVSASYLSQVETGELVPGAALIKNIATALGTDVDDLLRLVDKVDPDLNRILKQPGMPAFLRTIDGSSQAHLESLSKAKTIVIEPEDDIPSDIRRILKRPVVLELVRMLANEPNEKLYRIMEELKNDEMPKDDIAPDLKRILKQPGMDIFLRVIDGKSVPDLFKTLLNSTQNGDGK